MHQQNNDYVKPVNESFNREITDKMAKDDLYSFNGKINNNRVGLIL